jgi:hypothetical protein
LAVALLGSSTFNVTQVNLSSIQLHVVDGFGTLGAAIAGVASIGSVQPLPSLDQFVVLSRVTAEDVLGNCSTTANGQMDLIVQFSIPALVGRLGLGSQPNGAIVPLGVTGRLVNGETFSSLNSPDYVTLQLPTGPSVTAVVPGAGATTVAPNDFVITAPAKLQLTAKVSGTGTPSFEWFQQGGLLSGVGEVFFTPATSPGTLASFNTAGQYLIKVNASLPAGTAQHIVRVTVKLNPNGVFDPNLSIAPLLANTDPFTHPTAPPQTPPLLNSLPIFLFWDEFNNCPISNANCAGPKVPNYNLTDSATAAAYYKAIDPAGKKQFFGDWLAQNGINLTDPTTYHLAAYFNAIDLGFGRRMISSKDGTAWVVTNHRTVDDAVNDVNPIAAVAMEFKPDSTTGACTGYPTAVCTFTKFYIFDRQNLKVNPGTGKLDAPRVTGANLDGGGVKFLPGLCITCHAGLNPPNVTAGQPYPNPGGNVFGHFLPFDLNAFEYSSNPQFTREAQQGVFRQFNQYVLNIETNSPLLPFPFGGLGSGALIELIEGWYGQGFSQPALVALTGNQNSDFIPPEWGGPAPATNPSAQFYSRVIAHSCRNCHSPRDLNFATDVGFHFAGYEYGLVFGFGNNYLVPSHITTPPEPSIFPTPPLNPYIAVMPHTRRTFERFWLNTSSDTSPGNPLPNPPGPTAPEAFRTCVLNYPTCYR